MATYTYSKQVSRQMAASSKAASSALELAEPIARKIAAKLEAVADPNEPAVDWTQIQRLFGRLLTGSIAGLQEVDDGHADSERKGHFLRQQRDEAAEKLRGALRRARFLIDETLPKESAKRLFPQRRNLGTINPLNLARLGRNIAGLLRDNQASAKAEEADEVLNPEAALQAVETATEGLETVLAGLDPKLRLVAYSIDQRRQERKEALRTFRSTRELLRGFYLLAGFDYLADQLRDRKRKTAGEEEEPGDAAPIPAAARVPLTAATLLPA